MRPVRGARPAWDVVAARRGHSREGHPEGDDLDEEAGARVGGGKVTATFRGNSRAATMEDAEKKIALTLYELFRDAVLGKIGEPAAEKQDR